MRLATMNGDIAHVVYNDLKRLCPEAVHRNVPLAGLSRWAIGGQADIVVEPRTIEQLCSVRHYISSRSLRHLTIGATSNLLFADEGLRAICVRISSSLSTLKVFDCEIEAQAGAWVPGIARRAMRESLSGIEHICGIPGTLGGLVYMNGGSQRKGIGDNVVTITSIDCVGNLHHRSRAECAFAYRKSIFQQLDEVIANVRIRLEKVLDSRQIRSEMLDILGSRRRKFPRKLPNCGSVFVSDPAMYESYGPPGKIIERLGLKGLRMGGAEISRLHANFIVNQSAATAQDVLKLVAIICRQAADTLYCQLRAEALYVTPEGTLVPLHLAAEELVTQA